MDPQSTFAPERVDRLLGLLAKQVTPVDAVPVSHGQRSLAVTGLTVLGIAVALTYLHATAAYTGVSNRDIGRPQRVFVDLLETELVRSPVLAVGCETGELSSFVADRGNDLLGVDLLSLAVPWAGRRPGGGSSRSSS
jgi:hypothetical protein